MEPIKPISIDSTDVPRIDRFKPPVVDSLPPNVLRGVQVPVVDMPKPKIDYPRIEVPVDGKADIPDTDGSQEEEQEEKQEPSRELPDPPGLPQVQVPGLPQLPTLPQTMVPPTAKTMEVEVAGYKMDIPTPRAVAEAGATAIIGTTATLVTALVFNQIRQAATPAVQQLAKNKFKIKLKKITPVLHYVLAEEGHIDVFEYSKKGTRLVEQIDDVEKYIRDQIEINPLYEFENKVIIDEPIKERFTKEGQQRFAKLYATPQKIAKKLAARLSL